MHLGLSKPQHISSYPSQTFPIPDPSLLHQTPPSSPSVAQRPCPARVCMLAAAQQPVQGPKDAFAARGRSRQVAGTALARQASEERSRVYDRMGLSAATAGTSTRASHALPPPTSLSTNAIASSSKLREPSSQKNSSSRGERKGTRSKTGSKARKNSRRSGASDHIFVSSSSTSLSSLDDDTHNSLTIAAPVPVKARTPPVSFLANSYQISPSRSPSGSASMSPESYDAPPSPRSLEDQVHYAYAADDIHLAKILLLRLKGIEVTSDDDPRIAAVQDEDFDFCFVPNGRVFVNEVQERQLEEIRRKEVQQLEERKRNERLRQCEIKWFEEKQRLRQERIVVMQRKELKRLQEEERIRRAEEAQRFCREREEEELERKRVLDAEAARRRAFRSGRRPRTPRRALGNTPCSEGRPASQGEAIFVYDFPTITPIAPRSSTLTPSASSSSLSSLASTQQIRNSLDTYNAYNRNPYNPRISKQQPPQQLAGLTFDDSNAVSFGDVLQSMQGPLFPVTLNDSQPMPSTSSSSSSPLSPLHSQCTSPGCPNTDSSSRNLLLDILLEGVSHDSGEWHTRSVKGKEPEVKPRRRPSCNICSAPSSPLGHGTNVKMSASLSSIASTSSTSSSTSSSSVSSSSSIRRTSSWLSFRGVSASSLYTSGSWKSASSSATDLTIPSPSPSPKPTPNQWFAGVSGRAKSTTSVPTISNDIITTFIKPTDPRVPPSPTPLRAPLRHPSCLACGLHPEPISIADGPLSEAEVDVSAPAVKQTPYAHQGTLSRSSSLRALRRADLEEKQNILSRVARFVEMARCFQNAYAGMTIGSAPDASKGQQGKVKVVSSKDMAICTGTRARPADVLAFTAPLDPVAEAEAAAALAASEIDGVALITDIKPCADSDTDDEEEWPTPAPTPRAPEYIPLPPMPRASADPDAPFPTTALPNPLPYKTHFKPVLSPSRSPFRFHALSELHTMYPSQASSPAHSLALKRAGGGPSRLVTWRIRSVANPMYLRMRACQNILRADGQGADQEMEKLMGRQRHLATLAHQAAHQGVNPNALLLATVGGGRERVTGIAYEGLGATTLVNVIAVSTISRRGTPIICS
ncbi:hypothetical protein D9619_002778 [Psilocybe cf. subviscida]|uniref:Uncharacterized protein n=1 Tax=Psilocybe cf. subviscida TaxID=2480587 RepID=A0A8H5AXY9_9AGAR|nr:hypothetical protein D9619_002778 [Psilocybe cf. subviscida]